jgi:membrane protein
MDQRSPRNSPARPPRRPTFLTALLLGTGAALLAGRRSDPVSRPRFGAGSAVRESEEDVGRHAGDESRGRGARAPHEMPRRGWTDVLWRTWEEASNDRLLSVAAGVTFYVLLALFPAIAAFVSIYGLVADSGTVASHVGSLSAMLPGDAVEIVGEQVNRIAGQETRALGFAFAGSLLLSLWSANAGMKALIDALNVVYEEEEKRSFVRLTLMSLAFTIGVMLFLAAALGLIVAVPVVLQAVGLGETVDFLVRLARWPLLLVAVAFALSVAYRYGPSREEPRWRWVTPGGLAAAALWVVASLLFNWYAANFGSYNETYGSLGAAVVFMTWIWISTAVVLLGGELNAELEHQTAIDTTSGPRQPIGRRGARMADTVGEPRS